MVFGDKLFDTPSFDAANKNDFKSFKFYCLSDLKAYQAQQPLTPQLLRFYADTNNIYIEL